MSSRVVLAMSGGVDSSVAAYLLKKQGYDVIGLFMRTGVHAHDDSTPSHKRGCCSAVDASDARRVADRLDIPFYALDFAEDFTRIMDYFVDEYAVGRTPNPCVVCNTWLKFGKLWEYGKQLEADFVATGHYAQIRRGGETLSPSPRRGEGWGEGAIHSSASDDPPHPRPLSPAGRGENIPELCRAVDAAKDQSYVLYGLSREILPHLLFPIGGYRKDEIRAIAREANLGVAEKPDSVEICFVPGNDHAAFIRERRPALQTAGNIVDTEGRVLATHGGIEQFTIGQRKGFGFGSSGRRYVLDIIPETRDVVIGEREELLAKALIASRVNWLIEPPNKTFDCQAKIRYRHQPVPARVTTLADGGVRVDFAEAQSAITPGQAVVFYDGERVLGGAWIGSSC